ncbi:hypothetical protein V2J09_019549 [Rumex salicifolius]
MQCQSYLPLCYAHNDLNMDANGNTRPMYSDHAKPQIGDFNQKLMNFSVSEGFHLGYGKEFLRQTILQQEVTFKVQVQELHRLYRRQRELLDEIKRSNYYKKKVPSELQWTSNLLTSNVPFSSDQKAAYSTPFDSLDFSHSSAYGANIIQTPWASFKGESVTSSSQILANDRSSNDLDLSLSNRSIARRKPLNLHLPADEYINSEGKESFNNYEVSGLSFLSTHASNKGCSVAPLGNTKPLLVSSSLTTISSQMIDLTKFPGSKQMWTGNFNDCPYKKKLKMCKDNMETGNTNAWQRWQPCGEDVKCRSSLYSSSSYPYPESLQRLAEASQVHESASLFTKKGGWLENGRRNTDAKIPGSIHEMLDLNTPGHVGASHRPTLQYPSVHSGKVNPQVPIRSSCVDEVAHSSRCGEERSLQISCSESNVKASSASSAFLFQSYKCDLASTDNETIKRTTRVDPIDLNCTGAAFCEETGNADNQGKTRQNKSSMLFDINLPCQLTTDMARLDDDPVGNDHEHPIPVNLGSDVIDDGTSPSSASSRKVTQVDLEASIIPISPEKQECPRLRGQSEDSKTERTQIQLSTREDEELMKVAVNVLVSISSSEVQQKCTGNELLIWFAGLVSSMEQGEELMASTSIDVGNLGKLPSSCGGIDYFEAMTLKLTETSDEDYWSNTTTVHVEKEMCDAPCVESSRGRTTKRVRRKNFQREVLPSLASLSRYEASEDILMIEKLMEAAGTSLQTGVRTRKLKRKQSLRGRKNTATTATSCWESRTCLLALPYMGIPAIDLKDKVCLRWENVTRKPRRKRCRTTNPNTSLSQEGWMKKWGGIDFPQNENKKLKLG